MPRLALTRPVSRAITRCELTHLERQPIDLQQARTQHAAYEAALRSLGLVVQALPEAPDLPDSVFVEDAALVFDELAVITRPGAESRQPETAAIAAALAPYRKLAQIQPPATLDGGDVLQLERQVFVGLSSRSTPEGIAQLSEFVAPYAYHVEGVRLQHCLHLKSAVTRVSRDTLLLNPDWLEEGEIERCFAGWRILEVHPSEPFGANALWLEPAVIYPAAHPLTRQRLEAQGIPIYPLEVSELAKAEGGVTCCSLILERP